MRALRDASGPPELIVYDATSTCPYREGFRARLPMRLPSRMLTPEEFDARLAEGDRRHGPMLYRTHCPSCRACEPIRIDVEQFKETRSLSRVRRRAEEAVSVEVGEPVVDESRLALYEKHKNGRSLGPSEGLDLRGYAAFLVDRCVDAIEIRYRVEDKLAAIAVADRGAQALSAVYCYWDPDFAGLSLGTYSILKQVDLCRQWGARYLYLGLYVEPNRHMRYKARFRPHERLVAGRWHRFE